jgi:hypothetical protein
MQAPQKSAAAPARAPISVARTTPAAPEPRRPHPDEAALPELEALLAAIVRARESSAAPRQSR